MKADVLLIFGKLDPSAWIIEALSANGLTAISATSTDEAKDFILKQSYRAIVAGVHLEDWPMIDILTYIRHVNMTPLLFFAEGETDLESDEAKYLLNYDVIRLPSSPSQFLGALTEIIHSSRDHLSNCELSEEFEEFASIRIQEFVNGKKLSYDTFIKIGANRFVKYSHGSDGFGVEQIQKLREKQVHTIYLRKSDFIEYIRFNSRIIEKLSSRDLSQERKRRFIQQAFSVLGRSVILGEMDGAEVNGALALVSSTLELVFKNDDAYLALELLRNTQANIFFHSLNVSVYVSLMATRLGWTTQQTQERLILSALYHDVGILKLPKVLVEIPEIDQTFEERILFQKHVGHSVDILRAIGGFSDETLQIISQHHENDSGIGYPQGLRRKQINSLAKVLRVADEFCEFMTIQTTVNFGSINQGLRLLDDKVGLEYEQIYVTALSSLFRKSSLYELKSA